MNGFDLELLNANRASDPKTYEAVYNAEIDKLIRRKYSLSAELAILRQRDSKPNEFAAYNAYAEQCKAEVKAKFKI